MGVGIENKIRKSFEKSGDFSFRSRQGCVEMKNLPKKANKFSIFLFTKIGKRGILIENSSKENCV